MNHKSQSGTTSAKDAADAEAPPNAEADILDYDALIERCIGNIELAGRLLEKLQTCLPREIEDLEKALAMQDADQLARIAHRLRGTTANISAQGLCRAAEEIERRGKMGCLTDIPASMESLRREWERFKNYVPFACRR
jgi:HPt (histidine-containing phosphotransfer) domain-containing protein